MKTMKKSGVFLLAAQSFIQVQAKNALVIVAHGAPTAEWNNTVLDLEKKIQNLMIRRGVKDFDYVRVALMEFAKPTVADIISDCEKQKVDHIFVVPLFITASSHSEQDIPKTVAELKKEGNVLVKTSIPITVGPVLSDGNVIDEIILDRIKSLNVDSQKDALLLVAHGDRDYISWWNNLAQKAGKYVSSQTNIEYTGAAFVGMGQAFAKDLEPKLNEAAKSGKRVVVQGIYLSTDLAHMAQAFGATQNENILYSPYGLLPEDNNMRISNWIVDCAVEWLNRK